VIEFRTLGMAHLEGAEGDELRSILSRPKLLALLSYLAASTPRGFHRRDTLLALFWEELDQERARKALRQSLYYLRQSLGEGVIVGRGEDEVGVDGKRLLCDAAAFEEALDRGDREAALTLYKGEFLQGFFVADAREFERWLDERRTALRQRAATAAWELANQGVEDANPTVAARWGRRAVNLAPHDERLLRRAIKLLDRVGDRAGAVREYEAFARRLRDELELEPAPETQALIAEVRSRSEEPADRITAGKPREAEGAIPEAGEATIEPTGSEEDWAARQPVSPIGGPGLDEDAARLSRALGKRYRIERLIGRGGMATVYLAHDIRHERHVAMKVFQPELAAVIGAKRFLQEIKITAGLEHPHILTLIDSGEADGLLYYVMPYVEGESLRDKLAREQQLTIDEALEITKTVAEALDYAHRRGVIHRDIKPENILLHEGGAMVADFGIALAVRAAGGPRLTETGLSLGTPSYMSPEQATGDQQLDARTDIYSLGAVLYEMLVREPPYTGATSQAIISKLLTERPTRPRTLRDTVTESLDEAVMKALARLPIDRFATAAEFADALAPAAIATPAGVPAARRRGKRRAIAAAVAAAAIIVAALVWLWPDLNQNRVFVTQDRGPVLNRNRVLVMPFENRTGDTTMAVFGKMAADWIAQGLQQIDVIDVVPTATGLVGGPDNVAAGASGAGGVAASAGMTGAGTVVAGAYYRRGDSLEFRAQVIDAGNDRLLQAVAPVAGPAVTVGEVVDSLRQRVTETLAAELDPRTYRLASGTPPPSLEAYRHFIEGRPLFDRQQFPEALASFQRAVAADSTFFDARYFVAITYLNLRQTAAADSHAQRLAELRPQLTPSQRDALDWVLALVEGRRFDALEATRARGAELDRGWAALNLNHTREAVEAFEVFAEGYHGDFAIVWDGLTQAHHMGGDHRRELAEARRGVEEYPDMLIVLNNETRALAALGQLDELDRRLEASLLLPQQGAWVPAYVIGNAAGELRAHGYRNEAIEVIGRAIDWYLAHPAEMTTRQRRFDFLMAYYTAELWDEAREIVEGLAADFPDDVNHQGFLGTLAARRGDRDDALRISESLVGLADPYDFGREPYWQACIAAVLGDRERAMALLQDAYAQGRAFTIWLHRDMDLENLHDYPPFQELLRPKG
jgi:DNA-binding SARP family transcriptional activator/tRNA A-37 threonylcarbamoyl transferase component Bud32/TolB-like protein